MLTIADYKRITVFQRELLKLQFADKLNYTFATKTMELLDDIFGYESGVMAHLYGRETTSLVPDFQIHNVDLGFAQEIYLRCTDDPDFLGITNICDHFILSKRDNFRRSSLYKYAFKRYGYEDCLLKFIRYPDSKSYMSYIMLFKKKGTFKDDDLKVFDELGPSIAQAFANALTLFDANERYYAFRKAVRNFPVGIMLVERMNNVVFTNKLAARYMKEMGVTDPRFYSTFFTNKIYPYYQNDVNGYKERESIRIQNFIIRVLPTGNEGRLLDNIVTVEESGIPYTIKDIASMRFVESVVYMIRDDTSVNVAEEGFYEKYGLTSRERDVAAMMVDGMSNSEIANKLVLSFNTVKIHVSNIYKKVGVSNRVDLINKALRHGD